MHELVINKRLYYLDWLRFAVVVSLVPFHIILSYTGQGDTYVYHEGIKDFYLGLVEKPEINVWYLKYFPDFLAHFFMNLLFVISGFCTFLTLKKKSNKEFIKERVLKLFIPAFMGSLLLVSVTSYIRNISLFGFEGSFFKFIPQYFNGIRGSFEGANFEWGHFWFLVYLFVISILTLPLFRKLNNSKLSPWHKKNNLIRIFPLLIGLIFLCELIFRPGWPGFQNLIDDWANVTNYTLLYVVGFIIGKEVRIRDWFQKNYLVLLLTGVFLFGVKIFFSQITEYSYGYNLLTEIYILGATIICLAIIFGLLGLGERKFNFNRSILKKVNEYSFPLYVLHYIPVTVYTYFFLTTNFPVPLQVLFSVLFSYATIFLMYQGLKRIPLIRTMIGLPCFY